MTTCPYNLKTLDLFKVQYAEEKVIWFKFTLFYLFHDNLFCSKFHTYFLFLRNESFITRPYNALTRLSEFF